MTTTSAVDRRKALKELSRVLKRELNEAQLQTLHELERFGWELKYVRRKLFEPPIAILGNSEGDRIAVLETDGSINENPGLEFRKRE